MILKGFYAEGFRNIEKCFIEFSPGVNLLLGNNAQGKTNAIEGINIFSRGKSFRGCEDRELIKFGSEGFRLRIDYKDKNMDQSLEYALFGKERLRKKNGYKISRVSEMIGSFRSVLFYPDNLRIVKDGPEERRSFLNIAISQIYPEYIKYYADYKNALENRSFLLKSASKGIYFDEGEIISWSHSLAEYASFIYVMRRDYVERLKRHTTRIMREISDGEERISLKYVSDITDIYAEREKIKEEYKDIFTRDISREISAGVTLFGPHRDNLEIEINENPARHFASQGQIRSIVLSLKIAEGEVCRDIFGEYPVFLLDDVLSELDEKRRNYLLSGKGDKQIIITSCSFDKENIKADRIIDVSGGTYVSTYR